MAKTVVILGAGWAGLPLAHKLLKYTVAKVPSGLKVILVSPNSHFFWNVAATRGVIPGEIPDKELFLPISPAFDQYSKDNFEFVLGSAESIDLETNAVTIGLNAGPQRSITFDHLVIATGSRLTSNLPLKPIGSHETTLSAWHDLKRQVGDAKSIVVAGAGATGVEVAGELSAKYGSTKKVTLIISGDKPIQDAIPSVQNVVEKDLKKLGVELICNARVTEAKNSDKGTQTTLTLSNGSALTADLYLPLYGIKLNTSFVPEKLLDVEGNIKQDETMRAVGTKNIWAMGDVGNTDPKQLTITDNQIIHMAAALEAVLVDSGPVKVYEPASKKMIFISLGKGFGTGQIGNWKLFGFMVTYVKGRKLFVETAAGYVGGKHLRHAPM
ncbi:hypothetical protein G7046_g431 [Stylonectria norvegica]|nr:hypothetical protein G7046_g431 [Stylonectria norvegica]